jgi:diaminopimelate decarboxylase
MGQYYTEQTSFYGSTNPRELLEQFGSPLYVYNEIILRQRCREMAGFIQYPNCRANYSTKANANLELLRIIREEGLHADAMSPGEIYVLLAAGFQPSEIFYIGNNVSEEEMMYAIEKEITVSVDSLSQLDTFGKINPGGEVAVRINPGVGAGHHEKVVTGGKKTKFGINDDQIDEIKALLKEHRLRLVGINQHIGSQIMEGSPYLEGIKAILKTAEHFEGLSFIDLGGGFGIPYHKQDGEERLELRQFGSRIGELLSDWSAVRNPNMLFKIEPGRYITAECGILLGTVHALKENGGTSYVGTDLGFNTLIRPAMYDSWHDIEVYPQKTQNSLPHKTAVTIVGNICESGDVIAKDRMLPSLSVGDIVGVMDAGAYGYSMASNYNNRLRPAEVLICADGMPRLIRRRETLEDLLRDFCLEPMLTSQR